MLLLSLFALSLITFLALRLAGRAVSMRQSMNLTAYALMPVFLGRALGLSILTVISPLATNQVDAIALQLAPAPLGLAGFWPVLSLPWVILAFFDFFGLWSMTLFWSGLRRYLGFQPQLASWSLASLVLSWLLILTAIWQGIHRGLL